MKMKRLAVLSVSIMAFLLLGVFAASVSVANEYAVSPNGKKKAMLGGKGVLLVSDMEKKDKNGAPKYDLVFPNTKEGGWEVLYDNLIEWSTDSRYFTFLQNQCVEGSCEFRRYRVLVYDTEASDESEKIFIPFGEESWAHPTFAEFSGASLTIYFEKSSQYIPPSDDRCKQRKKQSAFLSITGKVTKNITDPESEVVIGEDLPERCRYVRDYMMGER